MKTSELIPVEIGESVALPLYLSRCPAGFPSPADSHIEQELDLIEHIIDDPASTYYLWADGRSMVKGGIGSGDLLVVNIALSPRHRDIVVACIDGENTVKRFCQVGDQVYLAPEPLDEEASDYRPIFFEEGSELLILGVVTHSLKAHRRL